MRVNAEMSDLFLNHPHERYDALCAADDGLGGLGGPAGQDDIREAITNDAIDFVLSYPKVAALFDVSADDLAEDFLNRI